MLTNKKTFFYTAGSILLATFLVVPMLRAQESAGKKNAREQAVLQFERDWSNSWVKGDVDWMDKNLTTDFIEIAPDGKINNKTAHIEQFKSGKLKFESMALSDLEVRFFGDVAVVTGHGLDKGTFEGMDISGKFSFTDILVFRSGQWKAASTQATKTTP
jgi:hypothetical protein